jgi:hypothetical protein
MAKQIQRRGRQATGSNPLFGEARAQKKAGRERKQVHRRSSLLKIRQIRHLKKRGEIGRIGHHKKEAVLLVDEFPGWVSETKVIQLFDFSLRNF